MKSCLLSLGLIFGALVLIVAIAAWTGYISKDLPEDVKMYRINVVLGAWAAVAVIAVCFDLGRQIRRGELTWKQPVLFGGYALATLAVAESFPEYWLAIMGGGAFLYVFVWGLLSVRKDMAEAKVQERELQKRKKKLKKQKKR